MSNLYSSIVDSQFFKDNYQVDKLMIPVSLISGVAIGFMVDGAADLSPGERTFSSVMGWTYFVSWAISFWPQVVTNYFNETTEGLAADKFIFDLVGFTALSLYECFMYFDDFTRKEYQAIHNGNTPRVEINDVWFALHSLLLTFIVIYQIILYDGFSNVPSTWSTVVALVLTSISMIAYICYNFWSEINPIFSWLNVLYVLSTVKVIITCLKFLPQVLLNYKRKATRGWNIYGTWLDLVGSFLSCAQLIFDCMDRSDYSGIEGNIVKLMLGLVSGAYDVTFLIQHYILYPGTGDDFSISAMEYTAASPKATPKELRRVLKVLGNRQKYNSVVARLTAEFNVTDEEAMLLQCGIHRKHSQSADYGSLVRMGDGAHVNDAFTLVRENSMIGKS